MMPSRAAPKPYDMLAKSVRKPAKYPPASREWLAGKIADKRVQQK